MHFSSLGVILLSSSGRESRIFFMAITLENIAIDALKKRATPLLLKEMAWRLINFLVKCGKSHPISFALRPIVAHKKLRLGVGTGIVVLVVATTVFGPLPSWVPDTGGKLELAVLPVGDVSVITAESAQVPVENYRVSQGYWLLHPGVDLAAKIGEPVKPVSAGKVVLVKHDTTDYGNHVIIDHGEYQTLYGHLSKINVVEGQEVTTEDVIGEVGSTGHSTGPHLHLELREGKKTVNPMSMLEIK